MKNIIITNPDKLNKLQQNFKRKGAKAIHIISDFDKTLTLVKVRGKNIPSLISILRDENYLTPDYPTKAYALFNKYHPIEIDPEVSIKQKKKEMENWWRAHFKLLIESHLNIKDVQNAILSDNIQLRNHIQEFFKILFKNNIPLIILSASGLGKESIEIYLKDKNLFNPLIFIISNSFQWDEKGNAKSVNDPIIHSLNKNETQIQNFIDFNIIKNRQNVILIGDSLEDSQMAEGFKYENIIRIGFFNDNEPKLLKQYLKFYDLIITQDSNFKPVIELLKNIL